MIFTTDSIEVVSYDNQVRKFRSEMNRNINRIDYRKYLTDKKLAIYNVRKFTGNEMSLNLYSHDFELETSLKKANPELDSIVTKLRNKAAGNELNKTTTQEPETIASILEVMPKLEGCKTDKCTSDRLRKTIFSILEIPLFRNQNYPNDKSMLTFIVNEDGSMSNIDTYGKVYEYNQELKEKAIFLKYTKGLVWTPGTENGIAKKVKYMIAIDFENEVNK